MTGEIALHRASMPEKISYAEHLAYAGLLPEVYRGKPANVLYAIEYGETIGIGTMAAITGVHIIKGKPSASASLIGALVRRAGHRLRVTGNDHQAVAVVIRADDPDFEYRSEWTLERAVTAKLCTLKDGRPYARDTKGDPTAWEKYPAAMLKARAITEVARDACEEVLFGLHYTPEELGASVDAEGLPSVGAVQREKPQQPRTDQWSTPSPTAAAEDEIADAEIVEESPAQPPQELSVEQAAAKMRANHPEAAQAAAPMPEGTHPAEPPKANPGLLKVVNTALSNQGINARPDRMATLSEITGRNVLSSSDLTVEEAKHVLAELAKPKPGTAPEGWTDEQRDQLVADLLAALLGAGSEKELVAIGQQIADAVNAGKITAADRDTLSAAYKDTQAKGRKGARKQPVGAGA